LTTVDKLLSAVKEVDDRSMLISQQQDAKNEPYPNTLEDIVVYNYYKIPLITQH
jgi:hypothetical protein